MDFSSKKLDILGPITAGNDVSEFVSHMLANNHVFEVYKRFIVRTGPFRAIFSIIRDIVLWQNFESTTLFCLVWICIFVYPYAILNIWIAIVSLSLPRLSLEKDTIIDYLESIEANLSFNETAMSSWCHIYDNRLNFFPKFKYCILIFIVPFAWILLLCPLIIVFIHSPFSRRKQYLETYENQRWWLGNWSNKGLTIGTRHVFPWSNDTGFIQATIPTSSWNTEDWMYSTNFNGEFHYNHTPSDFVRKRKWTRQSKQI